MSDCSLRPLPVFATATAGLFAMPIVGLFATAIVGLFATLLSPTYVRPTSELRSTYGD